MNFKQIPKAIIAEHDVENDGIGPYEYWGEKCNDIQTDYIQGSVVVVFYEVFTLERALELRDELENDDEFNDDMTDISIEHAFGDDVEFEDFCVTNHNGSIALQRDYTARVPEPEYDDYEDTE